MKHRQEVFNVVLAQLLQERGIASAPEVILEIAGPVIQRKIPDILLNFNGLRLAIEGEVEDTAGARSKAAGSAEARVEQGVAHMGVALVYPSFLRNVEFGSLKREMRKCVFDIAVVSESGLTGFSKGDLDFMGESLNKTFIQLVREDVVSYAVAILENAIEKFAAALWDRSGDFDRLAQILDIRIGAGRGNIENEKRSAVMIAGLIISNAIIFQEILSRHDGRVRPASDIAKEDLIVTAFSSHWRYIIREINYYPIFHLASELCAGLSSDADYEKAFAGIAGSARNIVAKRAALRHDLMGRVYHRLLVHAKYLGTYYTSVPAATLLLKLALKTENWQRDWHDLSKQNEFRVADLACGTGTLLMAAADCIIDNFISATIKNGQTVDSEAKARVHRKLIEEIIYGYDVLASAIHLTASTLALREPAVSFDKMNLFNLPLGGREQHLGSIEFARKEKFLAITDLFGASSGPQQVNGKGIEYISVNVPPLDLCVMNPPFTRSVGGNLLFGHLPDAEREKMQKKLKKLLLDLEMDANATAGLGTVFVAIADKYLKENGRMALVLPKALISGVAWNETRELFRKKYHLECIIVSHDPERWNFSENTSLSEALVVARKKNRKPDKLEEKTIAVNLWKNPETAFEGLAAAYAIDAKETPDVDRGQGAREIIIGGEKFGEAILFPWNYLRSNNLWILPGAFAQSELIRVSYGLMKGKLKLPGRKEAHNLPVCRLSDLCALGPDCRDVHDGFNVTDKKTAYPCFWGHDSKSVFTISQDPNMYLTPLPRARPKRPLRKLDALWPKAGSMLVAERLRLNTIKTAAIRISRPVLSNVWWPLTFRKKLRSVKKQKALSLWLNSTLGLIILLSVREETEGAWVKFKKPNLGEMPVIDFSALPEKRLDALSALYDDVAKKPLLPLQEIPADVTRRKIDKTLAWVLGLPDFPTLGELLAQEPIITLKRL